MQTPSVKANGELDICAVSKCHYFLIMRDKLSFTMHGSGSHNLNPGITSSTANSGRARHDVPIDATKYDA